MVLGTPHRQRTAHGRPDRGATLVEYALGLAVLLLASVGALQSLERAVHDDIAEHGATAGAPDLPDRGIPTTTATTVTPTTAGTTTTLPPTVAVTGSFSSPQVNLSGQNWRPSIAVSAQNSATGATLTNATITVTWTYTTLGGTPMTLTSSPCSTPSTGVCSFQLTGSNQLSAKTGNAACVGAVTVSVTAVTSSSQTVTYTSGSASTTITRGAC